MTMELLIRDLIDKIAERKKKELALIEQYKNNDVQEPAFIKAGKIIEMDNITKDLEAMLQYHSRLK
jgi:hypothetical protein